ncbi:MAG: MTH1187 family thiamine-binding protein [Dehalococcoidia bacterium]|nr:MTH1187 family thiamine-binding protein [Dehalococcoidia bacterium]
MKGQVVAEVSIVPVGTGDAGISRYVAASLEVLGSRKDLDYRLTPMGTVIEGPLNKVLDAIRDMHEVPFSKGALRVVTHIKIDDRRDKTVTMNGKLESVRKLRSSVKT